VQSIHNVITYLLRFTTWEGIEGGWRGWTEEGQRREDDRHTTSSNKPHLQCVIVVAVRGVLDADGGHSSTSVGDGTRNEMGGLSNTTHCRSNKCWLDILGEMVVEE